ncbi:MAG: 16S rRNA (cytosine(1402)-N(4))-methyltransferase RsmH [Clostridia bacterium]|nr:16S rRNA (cytosine(1402)-N(4))-methyltransferase RsmH [Clostridia bacterium]MDY6184639.1 16S rRNA (cytosine(1402)-N(4))-methyltransferase RsmH [Eubacteriales bacterium]
METQFSHTPVLLSECIDALRIREDLTYVDCTTGGGGHSFEIARRLGQNGRLICLDRDPTALQAAKIKLHDYLDRVTFVHTNFSDIGEILEREHVTNLGGVLADLGCSSHQFDTPERGFSYMHNAPLDMRMDTDNGLTAYDVVNTYDENELKRILFEYGEEKFSARIAAAIVRERSTSPIETTEELATIIKNAIPASARIGGPHPAKRSFQAIRIEVNRELDAIAPALKAAVRHMIPGGRIAVISFHSLEDRIVKNVFANMMQGCTCPRDFPVCVCGKKPLIFLPNKKPILPTETELTENPRSRSAKLRVAEKL